MRGKKKKKTLEEYCRIKVDTECVSHFLLISKAKYTSQTLTINHNLYKIHKSTTSNLNIKIVIALLLNIYKMQTHFLGCSQLIWVKIKRDCSVRVR